MSVDYYSNAVIGCEVPVEKLYRKVIVKHTEHNWTQGDRYCPVCGEEIETTVEKPIFNDTNNTIGKFELVWSTDNVRAFVGLASEDDGDSTHKPVKLPSIEALESELASVLNPLGLWDADKFGLYSVLYCSY